MAGIAFIIVLIFISMFAHWTTTTVCDAKITFKEFKEGYSLNPNRWKLYDEWVFCIDGFHIYSFYFGFIDYYRYKLWLRSCGDSNSERTKKGMLQAVQRDKKEQ